MEVLYANATTDAKADLMKSREDVNKQLALVRSEKLDRLTKATNEFRAFEREVEQVGTKQFSMSFALSQP
jgi:hypothetical protein